MQWTAGDPTAGDCQQYMPDYTLSAGFDGDPGFSIKILILNGILMRPSISNAIQVGTSVMFSQNKADMGTIMRGQDRLASGCNPKRIQAVTDIGNRIACKGTLCCGTLQ
jgi:hypothetical protein